ncbi:MAG: NUDIX hydrolase [Actinomycetota bacterium]
MTGDNQPVRAAGGVITRRSATGEREVLVAHRPRYDDWSFPKGKAAPGESDEDCALREVEEETGLKCRLGAELSPASYTDRKGRPKSVRYWAMEPVVGEFTPNDEVDRAEWVSLRGALDLLSYDHDRATVKGLLEEEIDSDSILLMRHGTAGDRDEWKRDDRFRPLDATGRRQAAELAEMLGPYPIKRILSSPYLRCLQSVLPLARRLDLQIETAEELAEGGGASEVRSLTDSLSGELALLCTHGDVIEEVLGPVVLYEKGGVWVLKNKDGSLKLAGYLAPPSAD